MGLQSSPLLLAQLWLGLVLLPKPPRGYGGAWAAVTPHQTGSTNAASKPQAGPRPGCFKPLAKLFKKPLPEGRNTCPKQSLELGIKTNPAPTRSGQELGLWQRRWRNPTGTNPQHLLNPSPTIIPTASRCLPSAPHPPAVPVTRLLLATARHWWLQAMAHVCHGRARCRHHRAHTHSPVPPRVPSVHGARQARSSPAAAAGVDGFLPSPWTPSLVSIINSHGGCRQP